MAKLYRNSIVLLVIGSMCCFLYGIYNIDIEIEPNGCRMTYMFGQPLFARVPFAANHDYPGYGLYYYYEGVRRLDIRSVKLTGAPVIFVPGNAGSYKQTRSLASVALRKAMHNDQGIHLDYFTVDYDEELSALYGGYLLRQQNFLKHCINAVLHLYKGHSKVVLIGHSMGGKLAQSMLTDPEIAKHINTIIFISTPLDEPVLNLDAQIDSFYKTTHAELLRTRTPLLPSNETNACCSHTTARTTREKHLARLEHSARLDNVLMISTGGGNRDLLVRAGLTGSIFNDVHAMTSTIPKVGLSCDHLSAVWCLQFMLVINRFLFSIASMRDQRYVVFNEDKEQNLQHALHYFVKSRQRAGRSQKLNFRGSATIESHKLVFNKRFKFLREEFNQLIDIARPRKYKKLFIEVINVEDLTWLYGCEARKNKAGGVYCDNATSLAHHIQQLPFDRDEERSYALLDLHNIRKTYQTWTHVLVQMPPSHKTSGFNIDLHDPNERTVDLKLPIWYSLQPKLLVNETMQDTVHYKLRIAGIVDPFQALRVGIEPLACKRTNYHISTRLCVPWAAGFERSKIINESTDDRSIYVNVPSIAPRGYNATKNPVVLDLQLDPSCRYRITYQYSVADSMARLVQEFYGWLPAHLVAVLFMVLKNQIGKFEVQGTFKSLRPYTGFFQYSSLYIVTGCRLLRKILMKTKFVPAPEQLNYCIHVSIIIHSSAMMLSIAAAFGIWALLTMYGNIIFSIAQRLMRLPQAFSNILVSIMSYMPMTFGVLTVALAIGTCSGVALMAASVFYFMLLTNAYKDYLEDLLWQKAVNLVKSVAASTKRAQETDSTTTLIPQGSGAEVVKDDNNDEDTGVLAADENDELTNGNDEDERPLANNSDVDEEGAEKCLGLQNFPYHITIFLLTLLMCALNVPSIIAWVRARRMGVQLPDPALIPSIMVLGSLSLLLQMRAPNKLNAYRFISVVLYFCASFCLLYCQLAIYRLNYIIAGAFTVLASHELFGCTIRYVQRR